MIKLIDLLNEGKQVGPLYHYTSADGVYNIVNQNVIRPSMNGFVSFTRSKNRDFGIAQGNDAMMAFDGDKLSNNYKITNHLVIFQILQLFYIHRLPYFKFK